MSIHIKYGPFTPQELEDPLQWLEKENVHVELIKDESIEKKFKGNDPSNILAVTEFRTQVYLAQIFYLDVQFQTLQKQQEFEKKFVQKNEVIPIWVNKIANDLTTTKLADVNNQKKRFWATVLIVLWVGYMAFSYFHRSN